MTQNLGFDVAHLLAGSMLVLSFVLLYQARITAVADPRRTAPSGDGRNCAVGQGRIHPRGAAPDRAPTRDPS
jgi:hypothetical protein